MSNSTELTIDVCFCLISGLCKQFNGVRQRFEKEPWRERCELFSSPDVNIQSPLADSHTFCIVLVSRIWS